MAGVIAGLSLQHHGSPFFTPYSHREAYTGDEDSTVHGVCTIALALANPPTQLNLSTMYVRIKAPYSTQNGTVSLSEAL